MDENLRAASEQGNVERLYELIRQNPNVLESINNQMFAHTPLHEAASKGHTMFMLEVIRLMPSFGTKLNPDGFSPIHLALQGPDDRTTILQLIRANKDVIRVKGRMGMTALHWVAQSGDINLLGEFLKACPESIEDLTDKFETALHVAVKNKRVDAVKVIVTWLEQGRLAGNKWGIHCVRILYLKDHQGNTALHAAVLSKEPQILMALPLKNVRNSEGKTALDVLDEQQSQMSPLIANEMRKVLTKARVRKAGPSPAESRRLANRLKSRFTCGKTCRLFIQALEIMSDDTRNALLVVAVLIATATYQVGLNPPDKLLHPKISTHSNLSGDSDLFFLFNHILLMFSIFIITVLLPPHPVILRRLLTLLLLYMGTCYVLSIRVIMPVLATQFVATISGLIMFVFVFLFLLCSQNNSECLMELAEN